MERKIKKRLGKCICLGSLVLIGCGRKDTHDYNQLNLNTLQLREIMEAEGEENLYTNMTLVSELSGDETSTVSELVKDSGIYSKPSRDASVCGSVNEGDTITVLEIGEEWHKVSFAGRVSYIPSSAFDEGIESDTNTGDTNTGTTNSNNNIGSSNVNKNTGNTNVNNNTGNTDTGNNGDAGGDSGGSVGNSNSGDTDVDIGEENDNNADGNNDADSSGSVDNGNSGDTDIDHSEENGDDADGTNGDDSYSGVDSGDSGDVDSGDSDNTDGDNSGDNSGDVESDSDMNENANVDYTRVGGDSTEGNIDIRSGD